MADKIAIVGSRNYPNRKEVQDYVKALPRGTIVVSGGAKGVDTWAEEMAVATGLEVEIYKPEWSKYGRSAGFRRNATIVLNADKVVAFTTGSKGTANTIATARKYGKEVEIHRADKVETLSQPRLL